MLLPVCIMFLWLCMYTWWNKIFVQALHSVIPCWKKSVKYCRMVIFQDIHHYQMAQGIKHSYHRYLVPACTVIRKYVFCEMWYASSWLSISSLRTLVWYGPNFCAVLYELLYSSCSTAAIVASSLAGVCTICEWPALICAIGVTLHVSWRHCYSHWNMLESGWHQLGECSTHFHASLPDRLLQAPRVKIRLQHSWCVYCMIIQSPCFICLSWIQLEAHLLSWQITL